MGKGTMLDKCKKKKNTGLFFIPKNFHSWRMTVRCLFKILIGSGASMECGEHSCHTHDPQGPHGVSICDLKSSLRHHAV